MSICASLLIGRGIIKCVFGELWPMESQVYKQKHINTHIKYIYNKANHMSSICMIEC